MDKKEILLRMMELSNLTEEKLKSHKKKVKAPLREALMPEELRNRLEEYRKLMELKVPTKKDLAALAALIRQVEEKVDALEEKLEKLDCLKKDNGKKRKDR
ncbi:hypothetical protein [Alteribacter natronophilus]|uniref:hypothetical protein n=1 Tax=Alteribacter natronophilus TaxID=2583810 RepID=UPI00110D696E|nr:hypothetical protein [Alteribacter natronophilus]TMW72795.1 hypothetical protein FGB90_00330 [Alteribacter natronophilus]